MQKYLLIEKIYIEYIKCSFKMVQRMLFLILKIEERFSRVDNSSTYCDTTILNQFHNYLSIFFFYFLFQWKLHVFIETWLGNSENINHEENHIGWSWFAA